MASWIDDPLTDRTGHQEFHAPVRAEDLLADAPDCIWPILMPCDLLPVLGNGAGDFLCLRIDGSDEVSEIVHWYHGGGDWIPWGKSLPDAIIYDNVVRRLPGYAKDHAIAAEDPRPSKTLKQRPASDPLHDWAIQFVHPEVRNVSIEAVAINNDCASEEIAIGWMKVLANHRVASEAFALRRIQIEMMNPSSSVESSSDADWGTIRSIAESVLGDRQDLAWAMNIAGDAASHLGDADAARDHYEASLDCSNFTDQSVRLGMDWDTRKSIKYAASRLLEIGTESPATEQTQLYCNVDQNSFISVADRIKNAWLERSRENEDQGNFPLAIQCAMQAGWDVGLASMKEYRPIMKRIVTLSEKANQPARAEIARTHLASFDQRYG